MGLQASLCSLVGQCVQKLTSADIAPHSDRIMQFLLQVFNTKGATAHEDAFMAIGFMADKVMNKSHPHIQFSCFFSLLM